MNALQAEVDTYNRLLPTLLNNQGKFALIKGGELVGVFDSYQDALQAGYQKFALAPFLVKLIAPAGQVAFFTRDLKQCRA